MHATLTMISALMLFLRYLGAPGAPVPAGPAWGSVPVPVPVAGLVLFDLNIVRRESTERVRKWVVKSCVKEQKAEQRGELSTLLLCSALRHRLHASLAAACGLRHPWV